MSFTTSRVLRKTNVLTSQLVKALGAGAPAGGNQKPRAYCSGRTVNGQLTQNMTIHSRAHNASSGSGGGTRYASLPKLPVQPLEHTMNSLLHVLRPLTDDEQFAHCQALVEDFCKPNGVGRRLQKYLEDKAKNTENWLADWWLNAAYLMGRTPLPVVTSPALVFPKFDFAGQEGQIRFASELCTAMLDFKELIDGEKLPQDMAGKFPFDMSQYPLLFGTNRIPKHGQDVIMYGKDRPKPATHIVVARRGHFFRVPVFDSAGARLSPSQLAAAISSVIAESDPPVPRHQQIGLLTTQSRDIWATLRQRLIKASETNAASIEALETCLLMICLDEPTSALRKLGEPTPQLRENFGPADFQLMQSLTGGGPISNAGNRWFDKTLQFTISPAHWAGLTYEHTPAEGPAVANMMDYAVDKLNAHHFNTPNATGTIAPPKQLHFDLTAADEAEIKTAGDIWQRTADDLEMHVNRFTAYGKNFPKSQRLSPDSYLQCAFQLAYYKLHKSHAPTYETGTLRRYHLGRTDTVRMPSEASVKFVTHMTRPNTSNQRKAHALRQAVEAHRNYVMKAMNGAGIDRHILGFKMAAGELGVPQPALLRSPFLARMLHFQLSTSQVPTKHDIALGFGPSAPDCYGLCYNPKEKEIMYTVTAFNHHPSTSANRFRLALNESLIEMRNVLETAAQTKAKL